MKFTTAILAATTLLTMSAASFAQDAVDTSAPTPPAAAPNKGGKKHFKKFKRAFRFGVCVGEQLGKANETLAKGTKGETKEQKQARRDANKALIKSAAQAGNCGKKKPKPTA